MPKIKDVSKIIYLAPIDLSAHNFDFFKAVDEVK